jgi:subtilisin family serine protease/subtilisin-like proprotein convertase family protein
MAPRFSRFSTVFGGPSSRKTRRVAARTRRGDAVIVEALERRLAMTSTVVGADLAGLMGRDLDAANDAQSQILVQWQGEATETDRTQALARSGGQRTKLIHTATMRADGAGVLEVIQLPAGATPESVLDLYSQLPQVRYAERNQVLRPQVISNDPNYANGQLWGMYGSDSPVPVGPPGTTNSFGSQAETAWDNGFIGSRSVYVGIVDEGIDHTHPDLAANVWVNPYEPVDGIDNDGNGYVDDVRGWDFVSNDNTTYDGPADDHGTHVAGTVGAIGGNGQGVAGVAWQVSMISAKFLGTSGGTLTGAVMALDYLTDLKHRHGINIVASNNSWGGVSSFSQALQDAVVRAAKQDILFVAAAGNSGQNNDVMPSYPSGTNTTADAGYDSVVAVTSLDANGTQSYSYGNSTVDLAAPGVGVLSTLPGGGYGTYSGTSMATPHVTGAIALYAAKYPNTSAQQIRTALLASTTPTASLAGRTATGGRLNVQQFLSTVAPPEVSVAASQAYLSEGQAGTTAFRFSITRKGDTSGPTTVNWAVSGLGSTPADGADFAGLQLPSGSVSFAPGEITKTITINVLADSVTESPEAFAVTLGSPTAGATLGTARASSIILNDDGVATASNPARITIQPLGSANPSPSTVSIATDGNPLASLEVTLYNVTHHWPDDIDILLVGPTGAKSLLLSDAGGGVGIDNTTLTFSSLASASLPDSLKLLSGTYRPTDFVAGDVFSNPAAPPGPHTADMSAFIGTNPNGVWSLYVQDDSPYYNGFIADGWSLSIGTGTTAAPVPVVSLAVSPATVAEDGATNLTYTFTRTGSTAAALVVGYGIAGTATQGTDYTVGGGATGTVTFAAGAATATVTVDPTADTQVETDETVALTLAAGTGYTIGTAAAVVGTITNDDAPTTPPPPTPPPSNPSALPRPTTISAFDLDGNSSSPDFEQVGNAFDSDRTTKYLNRGGVNSGIEFTYAVPTKVSAFVITTANDVPDRDPSAYRIEAFSAGAWQTLHTGSLALPTARFTDSAPVTLPELPLFSQYRIVFTALRGSGQMMQIADLKLFGSQSTQPGPVPPAPLPVVSLAVSPAAVAEDGATNLTYTFTRTGSTATALVVNYGIAGTATQGTDYTVGGGATGTITFAAGAATANVTVDPTADTSVEPDETVALTLAAGTGYTIGTPGTVVGTITNDDAPTTPPPPTPPPSNPSALPRPTTISAFDLDGNSSSPDFEQVGNAFDSDRTTKYLNRGGVNSGIEFTYAVPTRLSAFVITTANDVPDRDPTAYRIEGFSAGSWQTLHAGSLALPTARFTDSAPVTLPELPLFTQYRIVFTALRGSGQMMQIAELKLFGSQSTPMAVTSTARPVSRTPAALAAMYYPAPTVAPVNGGVNVIVRRPRSR